MTNQEKLIQSILQLSQAVDFEEAKLEWYLSKISVGVNKCICGKNPIKKICYLRNDYTNQSAIVGSSCVEKFIGLPTEKIFADISNLQEDILYKVRPPILLFAHRNGNINDWEMNFYNNIHKYKNLSDKQLYCLKRINQNLLKLIKET